MDDDSDQTAIFGIGLNPGGTLNPELASGTYYFMVYSPAGRGYKWGISVPDGHALYLEPITIPPPGTGGVGWRGDDVTYPTFMDALTAGLKAIEPKGFEAKNLAPVLNPTIFTCEDR